MKFTQLSDTEIYSIIDNEISQSRLDPDCHAKADQESNGNYDLMISRYFLNRLEALKLEQAKHADRAKALDERKRAAATQLIRYKSDRSETRVIEHRKKSRNLMMSLLGNLILLISSVSAVSALMILLGYTVHSLSYSFIAGMVALCLILPYLLSNVVLSRCHIAYQSTLSLMCILMCLGSASFGLLLMKNNPQNYAEEQLLAQAAENQNTYQNSNQNDGVKVSLEPAKNNDAMVKNP